MAHNPKALSRFSSSGYTDQTARSIFFLATADAAASLLTAGYFNDSRAQLVKDDVIFAITGIGGVAELLTVIVTDVPGTGNVIVKPDADESGGAARTVTATVGGLTTGLILSSDTNIAVVSGSANDIITLPPIADVPLGKEIWGKNGGTACEMRTPATSGTKINGGAADSNEAVIAANVAFVARKVAADEWSLLTIIGGAVAAPTPD